MSINKYSEEELQASIKKCIRTVRDDNFCNLYEKYLYNKSLEQVLLDTSSHAKTAEHQKTLRILIKKSDNVFCTTGASTTLIQLVLHYFNGTALIETLKTFLEECSHYISETHPKMSYINHADENGSTALMHAISYAAKETALDCVKLLIKYGAGVNIGIRTAKDIEWYPLTIAYRYVTNEYSFEVAKFLVDHGVNLNTMRYHSSIYIDRLLFNAVPNQKYKLELMKYLIAKGAPIDNILLVIVAYYARCLTKCVDELSALTNNSIVLPRENISIKTLLMAVIEYINNDNLTRAINNLLDINTTRQNTYGCLLLIYCYTGSGPYFKYFERIILKVDDVNTYNHLFMNSFLLFNDSSFEIQKRLIKDGIDIKTIISTNGNPYTNYNIENLFRRGLNRSNEYIINAVNFLLDNGFDVDTKLTNGSSTLLMCALRERCYDVAKLLIDRGADINWVNEHGDSILLTAIRPRTIVISVENSMIIELLLKRGAHTNNRDAETHITPLYALCSLHIPDNEENLMNEYLKCVELLLKTGVNVTERCTDEKISAFMHVCMTSANKYAFHCVKLLIDKVDFRVVFEYENYLQLCVRCLHVSNCSLECIELLLSKGVDPNDDSTFNKKLPLITACEYSVIPRVMECVKLLLSNRADANACDSDGNTPLHVVCDKLDDGSSVECLEYLVHHAENIRLNPKNGKSATPIINLCETFRRTRDHGKIQNMTTKLFIDALKILLSVGVKVNCRTIIKKETALMILCDSDLSEFKDNCDAIEELMILVHASEKTINKRNIDKKTAFELYSEKNNTIFSDKQLSFLNGTSVLAHTKPTRPT